jgi:membrane protease YdiL (CAAX protease family)
MGWNDIGFARPLPAFRLRLLWLPMVYILLFLAAAVTVGLPPAAVIGIVFLNLCFVGLTEEQMFRGVLLQGLLARFRVWPAVLISSFLFGAVHILNVFVTGDLGSAVMQCFGAGVAVLCDPASVRVAVSGDHSAHFLEFRAGDAGPVHSAAAGQCSLSGWRVFLVGCSCCPCRFTRCI